MTTGQKETGGQRREFVGGRELFYRRGRRAPQSKGKMFFSVFFRVLCGENVVMSAPHSKKRRIFMPEVMVNISVKHLAKIIRTMNAQELETLYMLLTKEGKELVKRKKEVEQQAVRLLTREEVFDV